MSRPAMFYRFDGSFAAVPGRVARYLWHVGGLEALRDSERGRDPEIDEVLEALRQAGEAWKRSVSGTDQGKTAEPRREWYSTQQAAQALGMVDRSIRKALSDGRLDGEIQGGRWVIRAEAIAHFRAAREGRNAS